MRNVDPYLFSGEFETSNKGTHKVQHQKSAYQITSWHYRYLPISVLWTPVYKNALEIAFLHDVEPLIHLCNSADEHDEHEQSETCHRQSERGEEFYNIIEHFR